MIGVKSYALPVHAFKKSGTCRNCIHPNLNTVIFTVMLKEVKCFWVTSFSTFFSFRCVTHLYVQFFTELFLVSRFSLFLNFVILTIYQSPNEKPETFSINPAEISSYQCHLHNLLKKVAAPARKVLNHVPPKPVSLHCHLFFQARLLYHHRIHNSPGLRV